MTRLSVLQPRLLTLLLTVTFASLFGCDRSGERRSAGAKPSPEPAVEPDLGAKATPESGDPALEPWRRELLELAFRAASKLPVEPHIKNRSRIQAEALAAFIELEQFARAEALAMDVVNWRQGVLLGELAHQAARRGDIASADRIAAKAHQVMLGVVAEDDQEWRAQSVLAKLALTDLTLGRNEAVIEKERLLEHSERRELVRAKAHLLTEEEVPLQLAEYKKLLESRDFEVLQNVALGAIELHSRFYGKEALRTEIEAFIEEAQRTMPSTLRFTYQESLAKNALEAGDSRNAARFVEAAQSIFDRTSWAAEDHVAAFGRLGSLRARAVSRSQGLGQIQAGLDTFETEKLRIPDVFRGDALRPVAKAYLDAGEREAALSVYRQLVEEGVQNPNSRPRVDDLVRTCSSLVVLGLEPDEALLTRLRAIESQLGEPW